MRDGLAARIQEVRSDLHEYAIVEEANRELIEEMTADPAAHAWVRVHNEDIGEPGCKNWHAKPQLGPARHAARLVARQDLLRLPVSRGAPAP